MPSPTISNAVILERIEQLRGDICEQSGKFETLTRVVQEFQLSYASEHTRLSETAAAAHRRLDEQKKEIDALKKIIDQLPAIVLQVKIIAGIAVAVGMTVGTWIVGQWLGLISP